MPTIEGSTSLLSQGWRAVGAVMAELWRRNIVPALLVGLGVTLLLGLTSSQGFVRDEGYYFRAAREYHSWFEGLWRNIWAGLPGRSFADTELRRAFGYNTEHPGFIKIFMGWTWKTFHHWLGWTSHATGYRLASMLLVGVGSSFTYLLGSKLFCRWVGLLSIVMLCVCPRVFYHMHLACFDGPIMGLTVVVVYAFWRSFEDRRWIIGVGLMWGIAVASKHNAVFLLPTLLLAWGLARLGEFDRGRDGLRVPGIPMAFVAMVILGPIVFYVFYPFGWHDPIARINDYYAYHMHHEHYPVDYFGTLYIEPPFPWLFPVVMSAITIPLVVLVAGLVGLLSGLRRAILGSVQGWRQVGHDDPLGWWLVVLSIVVPVLIIAVPSVPIFGGTKHWMTMMPFFCILGAGAVVAAVRWAWERWGGLKGVAIAAGLLAASIVLPTLETVRSHPVGHTYFNELIGGYRGGAALGMPRTFWGGDGRALLPILNEHADRGAAVFTDRMNWDAFVAYQRDGLLRSDLRFARQVRQAQWAMINHQREYRDLEHEVWSIRGDKKPEAVLDIDGVPLVSLYRLQP